MPTAPAPHETSTDGGSAVAFAVRHINVSAARPIQAAALLAAVRADEVPPGMSHHLSAFFDETDVDILGDTVRAGALTYEQLARGARRHLQPDHPTRTWLDERA